MADHDMDQQPAVAEAPPAPAPADKEQEAALTALSETLAQLEETPDNVPLLRRSIGHMRTLGLDAELLETTQRLSKLIMLDESQWAEYFEKLIQQKDPLDLEAMVDVLEAMDVAEQDYQSLVRHARFIIKASTSADEEVSGFLGDETLREMLGALTKKAAGLLDESKDVWQVWIEWEQSKGNQERIHEVYNGLLATPHTQSQATMDAYSSYCSSTCPNDYESRLVTATASTQVAKAIMEERRFHKTRAEYEEALAATDMSAQGAIWSAYIDWELDPKTKKANPALIAAVFERAVGTMAHAAGLAYAEYKKLLPKGNKKKGKRKEEEYAAADAQREVAKALKEVEAGFWSRYTAWSGSIELYQRAVRACPESGVLWGEMLFAMETQGSTLEELRATFERALNIGIMLQPRSATSPIVELFMSGAAFEARHAPEEVQGEHPVMVTIKRGFEAVHHLSTSGDPQCRLERFLLDWSEQSDPDLLEEAIALVSKPNKSRSSSYQMLSVLARRQDRTEARKTYATAIERTDLDWPEAVHEAYIQFETIHGTLDTLAQAKVAVKREQVKLAKRREKAAAEQYQYQYYQQQAQGQGQQPAGEEAEVVEVPLIPAAVDASAVEQTGGASTAQSLAVPTAISQLDKHDDFKRDRENTTIMVSGLASDVTVAQIESFLSECGTIREVILVDAAESSKSALVEFRVARSVPKALEKDRKRMEGYEVHVSMLWRSTLYITNFDTKLDDAQMRALFEPYGFILQTRWPSKKYATTRRFCYVTMQSPTAAQMATAMNGTKQKGVSDFGLTVLISDPAAKKQRSDAGQTTLFVGGLANGSSEQDVREQFEKHGTIRYITLKPSKYANGPAIAFVDMSSETEAQSALQLNGAHLNGSFIRVSLKDPNHAAKQWTSRIWSVRRGMPRSSCAAQSDVWTLQLGVGTAAAERRSRTVRLHNLPEGTQEGLLQQALEKIVPVKRLEVFARSNEANAELNNQSDMGLLLLRTDPFLFNGATITFSENTRKNRTGPSSTGAAAAGVGGGSGSGTNIQPSAALAFAPRNARKPGKTLGKGRAPIKDAAPIAPSSGQDDFRAFLEGKNKQREAKLAAKRTAPADEGAGEEASGDAKRTKTE